MSHPSIPMGEALPTRLRVYPVHWTSDDVQAWLRWCLDEYGLEGGCVRGDLFRMNGKALLMLTKEDFTKRTPTYGDLLFNVLREILQNGKTTVCRFNPDKRPDTVSTAVQTDSTTGQDSEQQPSSTTNPSSELSPVDTSSDEVFSSTAPPRPTSLATQLASPSRPVSQQQHHQQALAAINQQLLNSMFQRPPKPDITQAVFLRSVIESRQMAAAAAAQSTTPSAASTSGPGLASPDPAPPQPTGSSGLVAPPAKLDHSLLTAINMHQAISAVGGRLPIGGSLPSKVPPPAGAKFWSGKQEATTGPSTSPEWERMMKLPSATPSPKTSPGSDYPVTPALPTPVEVERKAPPRMDIVIAKEGREVGLLWDFLRRALEDPRYMRYIVWTSRSELIFKITDPDGLATQWGAQKGRNNMTYEKMSRGLRYYYRSGIMRKVPNHKLHYQFLVDPEKIMRDGSTYKQHLLRHRNDDVNADIIAQHTPIDLSNRVDVKIEPEMKPALYSPAGSEDGSASTASGRSEEATTHLTANKSENTAADSPNPSAAPLKRRNETEETGKAKVAKPNDCDDRIMSTELLASAVRDLVQYAPLKVEPEFDDY